MTWRFIIGHWDSVVADLQQVYGIQEHAVQDEPWPWLYKLIWALLETPSRLQRLAAPKQ